MACGVSYLHAFLTASISAVLHHGLLDQGRQLQAHHEWHGLPWVRFLPTTLFCQCSCVRACIKNSGASAARTWSTTPPPNSAMITIPPPNWCVRWPGTMFHCVALYSFWLHVVVVSFMVRATKPSSCKCLTLTSGEQVSTLCAPPPAQVSTSSCSAAIRAPLTACWYVRGVQLIVREGTHTILQAGSGSTVSAQYSSIQNSNTGISNGCQNNAGCAWIQENCARTYAANSMFNYCVPSQNSTFIEFADDFINDESWGTAFASLNKGAWIIFACVMVSVIISFVYMKVLEKAAKCLTFTALGLILVALVASGLFLLNAASNIKETYTGANSDGYWDDLNFKMDFYGGIALLIVSFLYLLLVCCMCKRILVAIKCVELASDAIMDTPTIIFIPFIIGVIGILTFVVWCVTAVLLFSAGEVVAADPPTSAVPNGLYKKFEFNDELRYAGLYHLFGLFWTTQFISAFGELAMAFVVVRWFFSKTEGGKKQLPSAPVCSSFALTMKHHLGTIAFGSLIIAVIKMVRAILEYIKAKYVAVVVWGWVVECSTAAVLRQGWPFGQAEQDRPLRDVLLWLLPLVRREMHEVHQQPGVHPGGLDG